MTVKAMDELSNLEKALLADEHLFEQFIQDLSVNVTAMFRDPLFFKSIREKVTERLATYPYIKIWVAGCSTGEEVYSLAILLYEAGYLDRTIIYATDINQHCLHTAREGIYSVERMKEYTLNYQLSGGSRSFSDYYLVKYNSVMFDPALRKNIVFSPHNLATDSCFNEFQMILCRNVLIYFNKDLQERVFNLFYESLCPFGYLALGSRESLLFSSKRKYFEDVDQREKIYRKLV